MNGKYIKYAFGEILLVVIGILIALSINNWNENRKNGNSEIEILEALKVDFTASKARLIETIELQERVIALSTKT